MATHLSPPVSEEPQTPRFLLAGVLTLAFFAALAMSFRYHEPPPPSNTRSDTRIALVVHNEAPPPYLTEDQREAQVAFAASLKAWVDLLDPSTLLLPNERLGFSQVRAGELVRPVEMLPPLSNALLAAPLATFAAQPLASVPPALEAQYLSASLAAAPTAPPMAESPVLAPGVYWEDATGSFLSDLPALPMTDWLTQHPGAACHGPTTLLVEPLPGDEPGTASHRVAIQTSSGLAGLDQLAQQHLQRYLVRLSILPERPAAQQRWFTQPQVLRVHWRQVPGVTTVAPPINSPLEAP